MKQSADTPAKTLYEVQIAGLALKLRSSHDEKTVTDLVQFVDEKVKEAMSVNTSVSFQNAIVLAALNIAEQLLLLKKAAGHELDRIEDRTRQILEQLEELSTPSNS